MPSLIDLPEADVKMWYRKHLAYKNATDKQRAKLLMDFLIYTYIKLGHALTWAMIQKETINDDPMKGVIVLTMVKYWAARPDYEQQLRNA